MKVKCTAIAEYISIIYLTLSFRSPVMADQSSMLALMILAVGVPVHFSLHKVEEGHVGVYYRVSLK